MNRLCVVGATFLIFHSTAFGAQTDSKPAESKPIVAHAKSKTEIQIEKLETKVKDAFAKLSGDIQKQFQGHHDFILKQVALIKTKAGPLQFFKTKLLSKAKFFLSHWQTRMVSLDHAGKDIKDYENALNAFSTTYLTGDQKTYADTLIEVSKANLTEIKKVTDGMLRGQLIKQLHYDIQSIKQALKQKRGAVVKSNK